MTKETINASDVIGQSYYIYNLSPSNNNPSINSTINITCTVTNVYGQAVSGKSITLYQNGTSKGSQTTSSNGTASWNNISMTSDGLNVFRVENTKIEVYVDNKISKSSTNGLVRNDGTIDTTSYSTFSGSYNDLSNKPTIPSASSTTPSADTTNGSVGTGTTWARSNHTHPKSSLYAESSHTHSGYQATLVSGTNIKTINNNSLLGSGNIDIQGSTVDIVTGWEQTLSDTKVPSEKLVKNSLDDKADSNHTHYNIYTTFGDEVFGEGRDYDGRGVGYGNTKLIYNNANNMFYYDKNGECDEDSGNELAVMNDLNSTEKISNKVTTLSSSSTDTQYPSAKCVYDLIGNIITIINGTGE